MMFGRSTGLGSRPGGHSVRFWAPTPAAWAGGSRRGVGVNSGFGAFFNSLFQSEHFEFTHNAGGFHLPFTTNGGNWVATCTLVHRGQYFVGICKLRPPFPSSEPPPPPPPAPGDPGDP